MSSTVSRASSARRMPVWRNSSIMALSRWLLEETRRRSRYSASDKYRGSRRGVLVPDHREKSRSSWRTLWVLKPNRDAEGGPGAEEVYGTADGGAGADLDGAGDAWHG